MTRVSNIRPRRSSTRRAAIETLEQRFMLTTFLVSNTLDSGNGSLRQAIESANASAGADTIEFAITDPDSGAPVFQPSIQPSTPLPTISDAVTIDGTTQTGGLVKLDGIGFGYSTMEPGLQLTGSDITVKGLWFDNWAGTALQVDGSNAHILASTFTNGGTGITVSVSASGTIIAGNTVGVEPGGTDGSNDSGIVIFGSNTLIGGITTADRNIIADNYGNGIEALPAAGPGTIQGNYIGNPTDQIPSGNYGDGIKIETQQQWLIGGTDPAARNYISGNYGNGITLAGASNAVVQGNWIGVNLSGYARNYGQGIDIVDGASNNTIGGTGPGEANIIANNNGNGVSVEGGVGNSIRGNSIYGNSSIGIDLVEDSGKHGPTPNDSTAPTSSNLHQHYPVISLVGRSGSLTLVQATLDSPPGVYFVDFFSTTGLSPAKDYQAHTYLGSTQLTIDSTGPAEFWAILSNIPAGQNWITATATDSSGNTSELSPGFQATTLASPIATTTALSATPIPAVYGDTITFTASVTTDTGHIVPGGTVHFALSNGMTNDVAVDYKGNAVWSLPGLDAGSYTMAADYVPNDLFLGSSASLDKSIAKATLIVVADSQTMVYGQAIPTLTGSISPNIDHITATWTAATTAGNPVGSYPITAILSDPNGKLANYNLQLTDGALTITKATLQAIVDDATMVYGQSLPAFSAQYIGLVNGDTPASVDGTLVFSTTATSASHVGTYTITADLLDPANKLANYDVTITPGTLTITKASLQVIAKDASSIHGQATPALSAEYVGLVNGDTAASLDGTLVFSTASPDSPVGAYSITPSGVSSGDYDITFVDGVLTIDPALTNTQLAASAATVDVGQSVTLTATIAVVAPGAGSPAGIVTFREGSTVLGSSPIADGVATLTISTLPVGAHSIIAEYAGDTNFLNSASSPVDVQVNTPFATGITGRTLKDITGNGLSDDDVPVGGITVNLYADTNGDGVLSSADGSPIATTVSDADGVYSFTPPAAGRYFVQEVTPSNAVLTWPTLNTYHTADVETSLLAGLDFANFYKLCSCGVTNITYTIKHGCQTTTVTDLRGHVQQGDIVSVRFTVPEGHIATVSLVSYLAPSASWDADNAYQQRIYDSETLTNIGAGIYKISVQIPAAYFQVDFVCGLPIDVFGPSGSNITYSSQSRLFSADNGGTRANMAYSSKLSGFVFFDANANGRKDYGETGIPGVELLITDSSGQVVAMAKTDASGAYSVNNLLPDTYTITELQPQGFIDGDEVAGSLGGDVSGDNNIIASVKVAANRTGTGYNFSELREDSLVAGDTATIGFWNNKNGQNLILNLNGSTSAKNLANWLAQSFPNVYGSRSANCLVYKTNRDVASLFVRLFAQADKLDAQFLAVALATYVTKVSLAGTNAVKYGFTVWSDGAGVRDVNIGTSGAAFGVADNTTMTVSAILAAANQRAVNGVLYGGDTLLRALADSVFTTINWIGDIAA